MALLNGRITPEYDNYTSTSTRGRAVVDYVMTSHHTLESCREFKVHLVQDIMNDHDLSELTGPECKAPDHALLIAKYYCSYIDIPQNVHPKNKKEIGSPTIK